MNKCNKCGNHGVNATKQVDGSITLDSDNLTFKMVHIGNERMLSLISCYTCGNSWKLNLIPKMIKPKSLKEQWFAEEIAIIPGNNTKLFKKVMKKLIPSSPCIPEGRCHNYISDIESHFLWTTDLMKDTLLISCEEMAEELFGKTILVTEDRVFIYKGDTYWYVDKRYPIINNITRMHIHNKNEHVMHSSFIRFSTEKLAKEWINKNKIILTTEDNVKLKNKDNIYIVNRHFSIKNEPISEYKVKSIQSYSTNYFAYFSTREAAELFIQQRDWKEGELYFVTHFIEEQKTPRIRVSAEHYGTFEIPGAIKDNTITWKYFEKCPNNFVLPIFN